MGKGEKTARGKKGKGGLFGPANLDPSPFSLASFAHLPVHISTKNDKSKDYCKADLKQRVLFFITIFRLAIPAFFRFTDVTELM